MKNILLTLLFTITSVFSEKKYAVSRLENTPKYKENEAFDYVYAAAPQGGTLKLSTLGTFSSLIPHTTKGIPAAGLHLLADALMLKSEDEPLTVYGLLAQYVELDPRNHAVIFYLNPNARFSDETQVTAHCIKNYVEEQQASPLCPISDIQTLEALDNTTLKVTFFPTHNNFLYNFFTLALLPIFKNNTIGSGPYFISKAHFGNAITYKKRKNYWAKDLPHLKGFYNFDTIHIDYFKDIGTQRCAFFKGDTHLFFETNPTSWKNMYNVEPVQQKKIKKIEWSHTLPTPAMFFKLNSNKFRNILVRQALFYAFDPHALSKSDFYGEFKVPYSLFSNTITETPFSRHIKTKSTENKRTQLLKADQHLKEAGWTVQHGKRVNAYGKTLKINLVLKDIRFEKVALSLQRQLKTLGIKLNIRVVDDVVYKEIVEKGQYDIIIERWMSPEIPGPELALLFKKGAHKSPMSVEDPKAYTLAVELVGAQGYKDFIEKRNTFDTYIMNKYYYIPIFYDDVKRWAYWKEKLGFIAPQPHVATDILAHGWSPHIKDT